MNSADSVPGEQSPLGCNICREPAIEPVIVFCGHMFCWACLYRRLYQQPTTTCPVCGTRVVINVNIIPFHSMRDLPIPEQRINHANDLSNTLTIPSRPTAPKLVSNEKLLEQFWHRNPQQGTVPLGLVTGEQYRDALNRALGDILTTELARRRSEEAFSRLQMQYNVLGSETLQLRNDLKLQRQLTEIVVRHVIENVLNERNRLQDEVRELRAAKKAMATAPKHI